MSGIRIVRQVMWPYHLNTGHPHSPVFRCSVFRWLLYILQTGCSNCSRDWIQDIQKFSASNKSVREEKFGILGMFSYTTSTYSMKKTFGRLKTVCESQSWSVQWASEYQSHSVFKLWKCIQLLPNSLEPHAQNFFTVTYVSAMT